MVSLSPDLHNRVVSVIVIQYFSQKKSSEYHLRERAMTIFFYR